MQLYQVVTLVHNDKISYGTYWFSMFYQGRFYCRDISWLDTNHFMYCVMKNNEETQLIITLSFHDPKLHTSSASQY